MKSKNNFIIWFSVLMVFLIISFFNSVNPTGKQIQQVDASYSEFISQLENGNIEEVVRQGNTIVATSKEQDGIIYEYIVTAFEDPDLVNRLIEYNVEFRETGNVWASILSIFLNLLPLIIFFWFIGKVSKQSMGLGKSTAKEYTVEKTTGVKFSDVAGEDEAKESLMEIVDFLHNPNKYTNLGAKLPKGALLVGPPGTGKTLLAKAVAGEAGVPFFSMSGSDFVEMFVGLGAARVRDLFKKANEAAPCIIFIDEIDAIGKSRESRYGGNDEREQTLNQLLSEMDGFDSSKGIIILAATNRPETLDPALLRPGRFDRRIIVERPDLKGRIEILKVHSKAVTLDESVDFKEIALSTAGASGADLANIVNEAAINAAKKKKKAVSQSDLQEAVEIVLVGKEKKDRVLDENEKKIVAFHEIGHAMIAAVQKHSEPVQKITIIPRTMGALGYVMQVPEKEKYLNSKEELENEIVTLLGGRASEEIFFHSVTTGAANDIEKATKIARAMITQYGMSDKFGLVGFASSDNQYLSGKYSLNCGDLTAAKIDEEVVSILNNAYEEAKKIIIEHKEEIVKLADYLIEKETITGKEFMDILKQANQN